MPKNTQPLRRTLKPRPNPKRQRALPASSIRSDVLDTPDMQEEKLVKRYVAWLRQANSKQRREFVERFADGLEALDPCDGFNTLMTLGLLVKAVGPVPKGHEKVCVPSAPCATCEELTITVPTSNNVCCIRGVDGHQVVYN
jgi:hypothetical protein